MSHSYGNLSLPLVISLLVNGAVIHLFTWPRTIQVVLALNPVFSILWIPCVMLRSYLDFFS